MASGGTTTESGLEGGGSTGVGLARDHQLVRSPRRVHLRRELRNHYPGDQGNRREGDNKAHDVIRTR